MTWPLGKPKYNTDDFTEEDLLKKYRELIGGDPPEDLLKAETARLGGNRVKVILFFLQGEIACKDSSWV